MTPTTTPADDGWLRLAVELAVENVADGGGPFGAVVVMDGDVVGTGRNRVVAQHDPTAHAEVLAIRAACASLGTFALPGATLYASCEPCPMCLAACLWARVDRVVHAADRHDAARAGFDDDAFHAMVGDPDVDPDVPVVSHRVAGSERPFEEWLTHGARVEY